MDQPDPMQLRKMRLEQCDNGWLCVTSIGKDTFAGRKIFASTEALCKYLTKEFPDIHE